MKMPLPLAWRLLLFLLLGSSSAGWGAAIVAPADPVSSAGPGLAGTGESLVAPVAPVKRTLQEARARRAQLRGQLRTLEAEIAGLEAGLNSTAPGNSSAEAAEAASTKASAEGTVAAVPINDATGAAAVTRMAAPAPAPATLSAPMSAPITAPTVIAQPDPVITATPAQAWSNHLEDLRAAAVASAAPGAFCGIPTSNGRPSSIGTPSAFCPYCRFCCRCNANGPLHCEAATVPVDVYGGQHAGTMVYCSTCERDCSACPTHNATGRCPGGNCCDSTLPHHPT